MFASDLHNIGEKDGEKMEYQKIDFKHKILTDKSDSDGDLIALSHLSVPYIRRRVSGKFRTVLRILY